MVNMTIKEVCWAMKEQSQIYDEANEKEDWAKRDEAGRKLDEYSKFLIKENKKRRPFLTG